MKNKRPDNTICYHASVNKDATYSMGGAVYEWIDLATRRHFPMIIKFQITDENEKDVLKFNFPVFPANIERDESNLENFLNGNEVKTVPVQKIASNKNKYQSEILNYIKNSIATKYVEALFNDEEKIKSDLKLKVMGNFNYGSFLHGIYSDDLILPIEDLDYQDNYVNFLVFKGNMEPLTEKADLYYKKLGSPEIQPGS